MLRRRKKKRLLCENAIDEVRCCGTGPCNDRRASVEEKRVREGILLLCRLPRRCGKFRKEVPGLKSVRPLVDFCFTVFGGLLLDHGTLKVTQCSKGICQAGALEKTKSFPPAFRDDPIPSPTCFRCLTRMPSHHSHASTINGQLLMSFLSPPKASYRLHVPILGTLLIAF